MDVRKYSNSDFKQIESWCIARQIAPPSEKKLGQFGALVPDIGCGFMYRTDAHFVIFDFFLSNPNAGMNERAKAMQAITEQLMTWASQLGYSTIYTNTQIDSIKKLAVKNGFETLGEFTVYRKEV